MSNALGKAEALKEAPIPPAQQPAEIQSPHSQLSPSKAVGSLKAKISPTQLCPLVPATEAKLHSNINSWC